MMVGLAGLSLLAAFLGPALPYVSELVGQALPADVTSRLFGLGAAAFGLLAGWSGIADRVIAPLAVPAVRGFRVGNGWMDVVVLPGLLLVRAADRFDQRLYPASLSGGRIGLAVAATSRHFDEADLDGLIGQLVQLTRSLGERVRSLQTGFVSRELLLAALGAVSILILALALR